MSISMMESHTGDRYTRFPGLNYGREAVPEYATVAWSCTDSRLTIHSLVLSWATVLRSLTGEEKPVFDVDNEPIITADGHTGTFRKARVNESHQISLVFTGIFTQEAILPGYGCKIEVRYCFQQRVGRLISNGCVTASYLAQVARQLEHEVTRRIHGDRFIVPSAVEDDCYLSILNPQPILLPGPTLLHELVVTPSREESLAIEFRGPDRKRSSLSYELLHSRSGRLASRIAIILKSRPASQQGTPVIPVLLPQSLDFYVAWLAILKAGAAVCPLNLDAPPERVNFIANDVAADIVITRSDLAGKFVGLERAPHVITTEEVEDDALATKPEICDISPDGLAYIMYTSGSTGLPKGVAVSHRAATQALLAHDKHIPYFRRFLQFAAPTFDVSVFEILFPLFRGATLVGCERGLMLNDLAGIINELDIDAVELTPTVAGELLRTRNAAPDLRVLLTIGEMLTKHVVDEFGFSAANDGLLYGMYGPTEAAIHCTIAPKFEAGSRVGNIGIPLDTVSAFVISLEESESGNEPKILPCGHVGELAVGGPQLATCYLNRPEENQRAFVETKRFGRLYRTGDKARLHPNGELECLGRISSGQIKLRGQRLELGEIESVLFRVSDVRNAAVCAVEGILVAFVSVENPVSSEDLRAECQRWLPKFMVPSDIICVGEFPRLPSGKIDRKGLEQSHVLSRGEQSIVLSDFESDLEKSIAKCAEKILGSPIHRSTNLAAAGLDSLRAIKLISNLRAIGIISDVLQVLEADTIAQIAAFVCHEMDQSITERFNRAKHQLLLDAAIESLRSIGYATTPQDVIPCSPVQAAMVSESMRNGRLYSNWIELEFGHGIEVADVKTAFCAVSQQNEILRSGFVQVDVQGYSYAQVVWDKLDDCCFTEGAPLDYEMAFGDQMAMLRPLRVEFACSNNQVRALVHLHHGLYDGWSWEQVMKDVGDALTQKPLLQRPQYRLFTEYYANKIAPEETDCALQYWREHLEDAAPNTWPNFRDRCDIPKKLNTTQRALNITLRELDAVVQELQISRQTVFQGAFGYLLNTYIGSPDIIFGTVSSGRTAPIPGIEDIVGPCISTIPLRLNLTNIRNIRDLLAVIHNLNRKSLKYGFLPLRDIKKASGVDPGMSLFDSLFVWQDTINDNTVPSAIVKEVGSTDFLEFTMTVEFGIQGDKLYVKANFEESIIPTSQVDTFLHQIEELASLFLRAPDLILTDIDSQLSSSILSIENLDYAKHEELPSLAYGVEALAKSDPNRTALEFLASFDPGTGLTDLQSLTYAELNTRANKLANYLSSCGLAAGDSAAIFLEKSLSLYVSILAVIKIGAGYVPITPQTPPERVNTIISQAKCRICITNSALSDVLEFSRDVLCLELDRQALNGISGDRAPSRHADSCVAYTIFTSGSTGVPKGVLVTHHNLQSNLLVLSEIYPHIDKSKLLQACSHAFDVSVFEIFYAWYTGMTLCAATNDTVFRDIEKVIDVLSVTHLSLTPTVAALVNPRNVPKVKFLVTAGEAMTPKVLREWADQGVYQGYGPSETTNICTVNPNLSANHAINNLGKPFKNTSAFVVSGRDEFSLVPRGGLGEFCFGGTQVGLGYLNMPEITKQKFIDHPEYGKIYRSGDFGRMLPDGSLAFAGRQDDLVKLRGQRIELGEINNTLLGSMAVKDCATMTWEDQSGGKRQLISFWVPSAPIQYSVSSPQRLSSETEELFQRICSVLPAYMIPSFLVPTPYIPMTVTGTKIDKRALLEQFSQLDSESLTLYSRPTEAADDDTPLSEMESKVAEALANVTQSAIADVGRHTSFYRLGLDSISAIALSRRLQGVVGLGQVDISVILKNDSVGRLSKIIEQNDDAEMAVREKPSGKLDAIFSIDFIDTVKKEANAAGDNVLKILPCTPIQEAMLLGQGSDDHGAYLNHLTFEVRGEVDALKQAWAAMIARHDIFRTRFSATNDPRFSFAQVVLERVDVPWEEIETGSVDAENAVNRQRSRFMLGKNALLFGFVVTVEVDTGKKWLHLFIHHALYDGEAMNQLLYEVEEILLGNQLPSVVPYDLYLEKMVSAGVGPNDKFWESRFRQMPSNHLIVPRSPQAQCQGRQFQSNSKSLALPLAEIENACKNISVTLLNVLQAAWAKLLVHYSGTSDVCFGEVFSCRSIPVDGAERIVGLCFNTLPIRVKVDQNAMNLDLMKCLQKTKAEYLPYQLTSLRWLQTKFSPNGHRLFDTLLLLQNSPRQLNEEIWKLVKETGDMDFPLVSEIIPDQTSGKLTLCLHFDESRIPVDDANTVLTDYIELICQTLHYPSSRATDFTAIDRPHPSFVNSSRSERGKVDEEEHDPRDQVGEKWSEEALEIRELISSFSKAGCKHITLRTTIFQLGLDSINAIQISHRLRGAGYDITAADIMEGPSIGEIVQHIQRSVPSKIETEASFDFEAFHSRHMSYICQLHGIPEAGIEAIRPCTPTQTGMLALFINSEGDLYFNTISLKSAVPLDSLRLKKAWASVVDRNVMLRTGFCHIKDDQSPFAMITYQPGTFDLPWYECPSPESETGIPGGSNIPSNLHMAPWNITFESLGTHSVIHFAGLHALYDAKSLDLIFSEVEMVYGGSALPNVTQVEPILGKILGKSRDQDPEGDAFWKELGQKFQVTKFPDLNPVHAAAQETRVLSKICARSLDDLQDGCKNAGITLQAAGQAAWARLLASYTGESNVTYGVVLSGRTMSLEAQNVAFPCLTTLPSTYYIDGRNQELLQHIMGLNAKLLKHQFTPLSKIQRLAGIYSTLFDTLFVFQKLSSVSTENELWQVVEENARTDYVVSIELVPVQDRLEFCLTFRSDIVPEKQAEILLQQLDWLLMDTIYSPESNCCFSYNADSSIISAVPRKDSKIPSPVELLHQFVEVQALKCPSKIALEFASKPTGDKLIISRWTYKEFDDIANRYARVLQSQGAIPGELIGICLDKCPEAYFAILAILKIGCAYVALDPGAPVARKQFIMEDSGAKVLLCTSDRQPELGKLSSIILTVLDEGGVLDEISSDPPVLEHPISPDATCYCLYTSGSTGTPKGCEITHDNAIQAMLSFQRLFAGHWDESSRWLQFASFHFDVSVLEQYWSWSVGICVTSCPRDILFEDLPGTIRQLEITHIDLTPSLARLVHPDEVPSLCRGVFITGGEALKQEILDDWGKHRVIYNGYGPTEVTIGCTMLPRVSENDKPSNIGPQFDNVSSFVFKPGTNTPVLRGGVGELCVSGPLVGRGYLNRPQLTEKKFQFLESIGERVYRTGDLVRMLHDETFCFLGRIDDQVKLRGQRLEIEEINHVIKSATRRVGEVVTMVLKHATSLKEQLVSFINIGDSGSSVKGFAVDYSSDNHADINEIRKTCLSSLPGYMIPTHMIPLTAFPLSPNNKIDNRQLKDMYNVMALDQLQSLSPPQEAVSVEMTEETSGIIHVLALVTGTEEQAIFPWSNIFELGLDSISAISFTRALKGAGFYRAQPSLVMKNPVIAALADALHDSAGHDTENKHMVQEATQRMLAFSHKNQALLAIKLNTQLEAIEAVGPCTPLQEGIVYRKLQTARPVYLSSFTYELEPAIDISRLRSAWEQVQSHVQLLRTRFIMTDDGYAQVVLKEDRLPWFEINAAVDENIQPAAVNKHKEWCEVVAEVTGELWEVGVVTGLTRRLMCLNIFHALYDGNSLPLLLEEVARAYNNVGLTQSPSYIDILSQGPLCRIKDAESFWIQHLESAEKRQFPRIEGSQDVSAISAALDIGSQVDLEPIRRRLNVTEQAVIHACWLYTCAGYFKFVPTLGVVVSGRALGVPGAEDVIGPMFNTIPCNIRLSKLASLSDLAISCHNYHISAIPYQHTPLRDIMKWTKRSVDKPLFETLFVFQKENEDRSSLAESLWELGESAAEADYPLAFEARRNRTGSLEISLVSQNDVLTAEMANDLTLRFRDMLLAFVKDPSIELNQLEELASHANGTLTPLDEPVVNGFHAFEWTQVANQIRQEIATLAGIDAQDIHETTSILEVGLDSIDAIKLSSRLRKAGTKLPVSVIMSGRTIQTMLKGVTSESKDEAGQFTLPHLEMELRSYLEREGYDPSSFDHVLPATPLQEGMVAEMVASDYHRYFNHDALEIKDHVDTFRLKAAWEAVVKANPILRTSFTQVSDPKLSFSYAQAVYSAEEGVFWSEEEADGKTIETTFEEERQYAVKSQLKGPLLRLKLLNDMGKRFLVVSVSHALYDGWSLDLLHQDVMCAYTGQIPSRPSYHAFLQHIVNSSGEKSLQFWKGTLDGVNPTPFPKQINAGGNLRAVHRQERTLNVSGPKVTTFCKTHGVTAQALGLTCWALVLAEYIGRLDIVFGTILFGRDFDDAEHIMFPAMNSVAIRTILHGSRAEMLKYVQEMLGNIFEHQHFPLRMAKALAGLGGRDIFDTLFIYQKKPSEKNSPSDGLYKSVGDSSRVEFPVCAEMELLEDSVMWRVACIDSVMGEQDTSELLERVEGVLNDIIDLPQESTIRFTDGETPNSSIFLGPRNQREETAENVKLPSDDEWTPLEDIIRTVLSSVASVPIFEISKQMTLFHLGLDSISAIKVSSLLKKESVSLAVSDLLQAGTIPNMAQVAQLPRTTPTLNGHISKEINLLEDEQIKKLLLSRKMQLHNVESVLPATAGQIYMLEMWSSSKGRLFYPDFFYTVKGDILKERLDHAWNRLVQRLPILRTTLLRTENHKTTHVQATLKDTKNPIVWRNDLRNSRDRQYVECQEHVVPVTLYASQTPNDTVLMLHIHHALYDAVSLSGTVGLLARLCNNEMDVDKGTMKMGMSGFVTFNTGDLPLKKRKMFWKGYLSGLKSHRQIAAHSDDVKLSTVSNYNPSLVEDITGLEAVARAHGISVQAVFLAIYAKIHLSLDLAVKGNSPEDLILGIYLANRSHPLEGPSDLLAPTLNIVPLCIRGATERSVLDLASNIQSDIHDISRAENSCVSLVEIAEWTGITLDTFVNFLRYPDLVEPNGVRNREVDIVPLAEENTESDTTRDSGARLTDGDASAGLSNKKYKDVFKPGIDIEAAIRNKGLDVGIFGACGRLDAALAGKVQEEIRQGILVLVEGSGCTERQRGTK